MMKTLNILLLKYSAMEEILILRFVHSQEGFRVKTQLIINPLNMPGFQTIMSKSKIDLMLNFVDRNIRLFIF